SSIDFNITLDEDGYCEYSLDSGVNNVTMTNNGNRDFNHTNSSIADNSYTMNAYCNDTSGNNNYTGNVTFEVDVYHEIYLSSDLIGNYQINGSINATITNGTTYTSNQFINFTHSTYGKRLQLHGLFSSSNVDLSNLTINHSATKVVVDVSSVSGIASNHTLFLPNNHDSAVYICPDATTLEDVSGSCANSVWFTYAEASAGTRKNSIYVIIEENYYKIENLTGTGAGEDDTSPDINFTDPTPSNASTQSNNYIYVNLSTNDTSNHYSFVDFDKDLQLWMRMDDTTSSGNPADLSSYSNNGTLVGNALINSTGKFGNASHFDGDGDYIVVGAGFNGLVNVSVSLWFYANEITTANPWLFNRYASTADEWGIRLVDWPPDRLVLYDDIDNANQNEYYIAVDQQKWYHVVGTMEDNGDGTYENKFYVNGILIGSGSNATGSWSSFAGTSYIGTRVTTTSEFNGTIDEVMIWNRTLSLEEVQSLYNASANQYENNFTGLAEGAHTFTGYAVDLAGNKNQTEERTVTITSDSTPPTITVISPTNNSNFNENSVGFNISISEEGSWCGLSISGAANQTMMINASGTGANYTNSSIADGSYTFIATCNDTANNYNTSDTYNFLIDTLNPDINFTNPTPSNDSTQSNTDIYVNVTSSDTSDHYSFIDFDDSLVGWWRMDDTNSSGDPIDLSSYSNNGTAFGNAVQTDLGYWGKGFEFDGDGDYIEVPGLDNSFSSSFTVSGWIKTGDKTTSPTIISDYYFDNSDIPTYYYGWELLVSSSKFTAIIGDKDAETSYSHSTDINDSSWHHFVAVFGSGGGLPKLYVYDVASNPDIGPNSISSNAGRKFRIADQRLATGSGNQIDAMIDEILIFNRTLTSAEISALYNASANQYENNFTNLDYDTHEFTGYAVDIAGNKNETEERQVTTRPEHLLVTSAMNCSELRADAIKFEFGNDCSNSDYTICLALDSTVNITSSGKLSLDEECNLVFNSTADGGFGLFVEGTLNMSGVNVTSNSTNQKFNLTIFDSASVFGDGLGNLTYANFMRQTNSH
ncbi:MAG: LamG domain-containing protein, partial [Nanoarchaeota archaeon]|nr:LamG domain-containing protein [Nanoarchaeota archaeon]